jgi:flagellar protein FliS
LAYKDVSSTYKETRVKTASQGQLIIMLYDEAIRQLIRATELLEQNSTQKKDPGKIEQISKSVMKAEEIITELMVSLDFEQGGEISRNLFSLYTWFNRELLEGNIAQDFKRIKTVLDMLSSLRSSWSEIARNYTAEQGNREAVGLDIAG